MKFRDLLVDYKAEDIFPRIGVSLAVNSEDQKRQFEAFKKSYQRIKQIPEEDNNYLIFGLKGYFYERPDATSIDCFMLDKDDISKYQQLTELEQYMLADASRNKKIARTEIRDIKTIISNNVLPEFEEIELAPWTTVVNAQVDLDNIQEVNRDDFVCCVIDLMMSFDANEKKSHEMVKKNREENANNPLTLGHRRKTQLARHLYKYKVLQTLAHRKG